MVAALALLVVAIAVIVAVAIQGWGMSGGEQGEARATGGSWRGLPRAPGGDVGRSGLSGIRLGDKVVIMAGATYAATRVDVITFDLRAR